MNYKKGQIVIYNLPYWNKTKGCAENKKRPMLILKPLEPLNGKELLALPISSHKCLDIDDVLITAQESGCDYPTSVVRVSRPQCIYEDGIEQVIGDLKTANLSKWNQVLLGAERAFYKSLW
ncbi:MAG: type II toxin-antitoxin system PemK/MazF family toxin [Solobacterium sp.]|nr:type II toxin-antitoxin system PemK/MazF family toxin [Solobacterium sp.]